MKREHERFAAAAVASLLCCLMAACGPKASTDEALTAEVQARLNANSVTQTANVKVTVEQGVATLSGDVSNSEVARQATAVASSTQGITSVKNQMTLAETAASAQAALSVDPGSPALPTPPPPPVAGPAHHEEMIRRDGDQALAAPPSRSGSLTIPAGQTISVRTIDRIDTHLNQDGQVLRVALSAPVTEEGRLIIPAGTPAAVLLTKVQGAFELRLTSINYHGERQYVSTSVYVKGKQTQLPAGSEITFSLELPLVLTLH